MIGPLSFGGTPIVVECPCGFRGEYLVYGNSTMVIYCRSGVECAVESMWREEGRER